MELDENVFKNENYYKTMATMDASKMFFQLFDNDSK